MAVDVQLLKTAVVVDVYVDIQSGYERLKRLEYTYCTDEGKTCEGPILVPFSIDRESNQASQHVSGRVICA